MFILTSKTSVLTVTTEDESYVESNTCSVSSLVRTGISKLELVVSI